MSTSNLTTDPTSTASGDGSPLDVASLRRVRTGVRLVLALGITASLAANVEHAEATWTGRLISGWSPVALALAVELGSRVPLTRSVRAVVRWIATALIAGIAAWVSYWHMESLAEHHGETGASAHLLPLSVDGLVIVASVCLVEITDRLRTAAHLVETSAAPAADGPSVPSPHAAPETSAHPSPDTSSGGSSSGSSRRSSPGSSSGSSRSSSARSSRGTSGRSSGKARPAVDDETLRALVAQARAARPRAGEPAVRRLLADAGLSASSAKVRAALAAHTAAATASGGVETSSPLVSIPAEDGREVAA